MTGTDRDIRCFRGSRICRAPPRSNRALTALRALLRSNEFYLIPLALVIGVVAGAIVTLMSEIAQIAHVLIFGIPIDVRLSANAYVNPVIALVAPALGGLSLGIMEWSAPPLKISSAVDPIEANALARRSAVGARQRGGERADADLQRLRRVGRP